MNLMERASASHAHWGDPLIPLFLAILAASPSS
jgi:hypothetical protein